MKELKAIRIELRPNFYRPGYCQFLIQVYADGEFVLALNEVVEESHFKSIGEYAFESVVRKFRDRMGWGNGLVKSKGGK